MTVTTHPETVIVADPTIPAIRTTREFAATPAQVFRAHTDPEIYGRWIGPDRLTLDAIDFDCRTGGSWSFSHSDPEGTSYAFYGCFHEVRQDELIVQTFTFADYPDGVSLERLSFEDIGDGRCRLTGVSLVDSFEARDAIITSGMEAGVSQGYDKLDDLLAK